MAPTVASKELRYIFLTAATIIVLVISLTKIEDKYAAESNAKFLRHFKPAIHKQIDLNISKFSLATLNPEQQLQALCMDVDTVNTLRMTSLKFSKIITKLDDNGNITLAIQAYDMRNKSKIVGDDVIVVWARQENGDGSVSGHVTDHRNGTYTGNINVHWSGKTKVTVKLVSSIENTCLRMKALRKYGNTVFAMQKAWGIRGTFQTNLLRELTPCGANEMILGYRKVCNFTSLNGGLSWFCGKPKHETLKCSNIKSFGTGPFSNNIVPRTEKIRNNGHGIFKQKILLDIPKFRREIKETSCNNRSALSSWTDPVPSGYWLNNKWNFENCYSNIKHNLLSSYVRCLHNKNVVLIGDSTIRQYAEYFVQYVLNLGYVDVRKASGSTSQYHGRSLFTNYGINLMYVKHEMPFHNPSFPSNGIISVPQILHSLQSFSDNNNSLILIINYNSHFSAYPPSKFRERIRHLASAIESLVLIKPNIKIFLKGPHIYIDDNRWFDAKISLLFEEIIREEFSKLRNNVIYLDVWSISVTHNSEELHPTGNAFNSQIHQLMSYIC